MAISVTHKFQSAKADGLDATEIRPSNWNDTHNMTMASGKLLGRVSSGTGDVEEIDFSNSAIRESLGLGAMAAKATVATADLDNDAVTYAKMQNVSAPSRVLGRYSSGAGDVQELTIDSVSMNLSNAGLLSARLSLPRGYIDGFIMSNAADANNDITVQAGACRDASNAGDIVLASAITKRLDANWSVGTDQGGLQTGLSKSTNTWYHVWVINRPDTNVSDVLFSPSVSSPTMPTSYTLKRRVGSILTNSSGNIIAFKQVHDAFYWVTPIQSANNISVGTAGTAITLSVPTGINVEAEVSGMFMGLVDQHVAFVYPTDSSVALTTQSGPAVAGGRVMGSANEDFGEMAFHKQVWTNTSAQIRALGSRTQVEVDLYTLGWMDPRGRNA